MFAFIRREPAAVAGVLSAVIALAVSFGLHLSDVQVGSITAFVSLVTSLIVRQNVSPTASDPAAPAAPTGSTPITPAA